MIDCLFVLFSLCFFRNGKGVVDIVSEYNLFNNSLVEDNFLMLEVHG